MNFDGLHQVWGSGYGAAEHYRVLPFHFWSAKRAFLLCFLVLFAEPALFTFAAGEQAKDTITFEKTILTIDRADGTSVTLNAELALTRSQQEQGLMYRKALSDGAAMLFVSSKDQQQRFWMKNTLIDLSIAYIASDGRIVEIFDMRAGDLSITASTRSVRYALEVPKGWFTRAGVQAGDMLRIEKSLRD
ncbi:DUF192 domain-containing protein [Breznakiellaceae bacterium SP9]